MTTEPTPSTKVRLFALSGNRCAFPDCTHSFVSDTHVKPIYAIAHITAENPGGPRYDPTQTDDERRSFDNLMLLCPNHHALIDKHPGQYPVETLLGMKQKHEKQYANWHPSPDVSAAFDPAGTAVESLRRYLVDDQYRVQCRTLVNGEVEQLCSQLSEKHFPIRMQDGPYRHDEVVHRFARYEAVSSTMQALMIAGCFDGERQHISLWVNALDSIGNCFQSAMSTELVSAQFYPALLLLYAGGVAAIAAGKYDAFAALVTQPKVRDMHGQHHLTSRVRPHVIAGLDIQQGLSDATSKRNRMSEHIRALLREEFRDYIPDDVRYRRTFDRFEYLLALEHSHLEQKAYGSQLLMGGCFMEPTSASYEASIVHEIHTEARSAGESWQPLQAGLFDGSLDAFRNAEALYKDIVRKRYASPWL